MPSRHAQAQQLHHHLFKKNHDDELHVNIMTIQAIDREHLQNDSAHVSATCLQTYLHPYLQMYLQRIYKRIHNVSKNVSTNVSTMYLHMYLQRIYKRIYNVSTNVSTTDSTNLNTNRPLTHAFHENELTCSHLSNDEECMTGNAYSLNMP